MTDSFHFVSVDRTYIMSAPSKSFSEVTTPVFVVPPVFNAAYFNTPDPQSVLVHAVSSSSEDEGFQAVICLHPQPDLPSHLGLPSLTNYEEKAFLQVSPVNEPFIYQSHASPANVMQITVTEYLILLHFIEHEWPRLHSKLESQLTTMREGTDPVYMTGHLMFYNHGSSHFRVSFSSRLAFAACIQSRHLEHGIKAWLERRPLSDIHEDYQEMVLPMKSLVVLTQDAASVKVLLEQMAIYKSRFRKQTKSVVS